jgi:HSP20 family protein
MDLSETDEEYRLKMDLPGVSKDDIDVSVENHRLRIRGTREEETKEEEENFLRVERSRGSFYRSVPFPDPANLEGAEAEYDSGTLTVRVPKQEEQESKKISIS